MRGWPGVLRVQPGQPMRINDISLERGGMFDIQADWNPPHDSHRSGTDVDIENLAELRELQDALRPYSWTYIAEKKKDAYPHFRFNKGGFQ